MNFENLPDHLFDLISDKKYEDLSAREKEMIDQYLSKQEYDDIYYSIHDFRQVDSQLKISPPKLESPSKTQSTFYRIINYKVPVYAIASSVTVLICAYFLIQSLTPEVSSSEDSYKSTSQGIPINQDYYPGDLIFEL